MDITGFGTPIDFMVMQSSSDADRIIDLFKNAIKQGYHPNDIEQEIYMCAGVVPESLTWYDKERIQNEVSLAYAAQGDL